MLGLWTLPLLAMDRVEPRQMRACHEAVADLRQLHGLPDRGLELIPDRVNHRGLAWIDWRYGAVGVSASGYCKVEPDGRVAKVAVEEFESRDERRAGYDGSKYPEYDRRDRDRDWQEWHGDRSWDRGDYRQRRSGMPGEMTLERDVAMRGSDSYRKFDVGGPEECAWACAEDESCVAYNYVERRGSCGLKDRLGSRDPEPGVISGVKQVRFRIDQDKARAGDTYRKYRFPDVDQCKEKCMADARCQAFNYRLEDQQCGLKETVERTRYERGVISGEKDLGRR